MWMRGQKRVDFRFLATPLRVECLAVIAALAVCGWNGALIPPRPAFANLDRLFRVQRDLHFLGAVNQFFPAAVLKKWETVRGVEHVAPYRLDRTKLFRYARVSPDFFDVLGGVRMARGRLPVPADGLNTAVITDRFWRDTLHEDAHVVGSIFNVGKVRYRIAGVLGPTFAFNQCSFFAPLGDDPSLYAIVLLRNRVDREKTVGELMNAASTLAPKWTYASTRLVPLTVPFTACSVFVAGAALMLGAAYLFLRWRTMTLYIGARIGAGLLCITAINLALMRAVNSIFPMLSVLQFWPYIALCSAAVYFIVRDQRSRCPTCLERLRMPVTIGSWSSLILDRPATEYVCPAGHGVLFVSEALHDADQWTVLDDSWRDLFAETTTQ
jgi:uncharacterized membrane protein